MPRWVDWTGLGLLCSIDIPSDEGVPGGAELSEVPGIIVGSARNFIRGTFAVRIGFTFTRERDTRGRGFGVI